ncbi:MAG: hypothetical protein QM760_21870 [Nibricoccus sp.]
MNTTADNPNRAPTPAPGTAPGMHVLDSPAVAPLPHDELSDLSGAELRRAMSMITIAWVFGAIWMHALAGAPLTIFGNALGAGNFEFGLLAALPFLAQLMSVPASVLTDRSGARRKIFSGRCTPTACSGSRSRWSLCGSSCTSGNRIRRWRCSRFSRWSS